MDFILGEALTLSLMIISSSNPVMVNNSTTKTLQGDLKEKVQDFTEVDVFTRIVDVNQGLGEDIKYGDIATGTSKNALKCLLGPRSCLWPRSRDGTVYIPYTIDQVYSRSEQDVIQYSMKEFDLLTCVKFVYRRHESKYIKIISGNGILFDPELSFRPHIISITKTADFHLRNIACLRPCLSPPAVETLIPAIVTSGIDYSNVSWLASRLPPSLLRMWKPLCQWRKRRPTFRVLKLTLASTSSDPSKTQTLEARSQELEPSQSEEAEEEDSDNEDPPSLDLTLTATSSEIDTARTLEARIEEGSTRGQERKFGLPHALRECSSTRSCWSNLGYNKRVQFVSLQRNGCVQHGVIQHELLHSIGFNHEQNRSDRDDYVSIIFKNVIKGAKYNFDRLNTNNLGTPYDYSSVMHYGKFSFSKDGRSTTIVPKPNPNVPIGQRFGMSSLDALKVNKLYKCSSTRTLTVNLGLAGSMHINYKPRFHRLYTHIDD
ncbi:low choriolytic enzyme-like [Heptranchias perlo]|uniref:low choriolytic enzyme-like n=1 Tax=Heptranchias perlo TaxID=212740 RepID=UPI00355A91BB